MSLQSRLTDFISLVGADIKAINTALATKYSASNLPSVSGGVFGATGNGNTTIANLNQHLRTGFYNGDNLTGAPNGSTAWWYVQVQTHHFSAANSSWQRQIAWDMTGATYACWTRYINGTDPTVPGNWSEWVELPTPSSTSLTIAEPAVNDAVPTSPSSGLRLFLRKRAGRRMLSMVGPDGHDSALQPAIFSNRVAWWAVLPNAQTSTAMGIAITTANAGGAYTPVAVAQTSTNFFTRMVRQRLTTTALAGQVVSARSANASFMLSATPNAGGFFAAFRFGLAAAASGNRHFIGLSSTTAVLTGAADPTTLFNLIGLACNAGQTTWRIISNDGAGTATAVDLGANFPCTTSGVDFYELRLYAASGATGKVGWSLMRINTGHFVEGEITTDLPAADLLLTPHFHFGTGTSAAAVSADIQSLYIETDN